MKFARVFVIVFVCVDLWYHSVNGSGCVISPDVRNYYPTNNNELEIKNVSIYQKIVGNIA